MLVLNDPTVRLPCRYGHQGAALQCAPAPYLWIHIFQGRLQLLQLLSRQVVEDLILVEVLVFAQVLLVQRHGCVAVWTASYALLMHGRRGTAPQGSALSRVEVLAGTWREPTAE